MNKLIDLEDVYRSHIKLVRKIISGFSITNGLADDLAQQTFLRVFEKISSLQDIKLLRPWISSIARNYCLDSFRSKRFIELEDFRDEGDATPGEYQLGLWFDPESSVADLELEQNLRMLDQLFKEYKKEPRGSVARLYYRDGKSTKEIALEMAISQNTVLSHLLLFRREMKTALIMMGKNQANRPSHRNKPMP